MGGANAGDVASQLARDTIREFVLHRRRRSRRRRWRRARCSRRRSSRPRPRCSARPQRNRDRHGHGHDGGRVPGGRSAARSRSPTSATAARTCWRDGRLQALTRDHTIVEELVDRGLLSADEAERHPYKNVLSRNLGAQARDPGRLPGARAPARRPAAAVLRRAVRLRLGRGDPVPAGIGRRARARRARSDRARAARRRRRQRLGDRDRGAAGGAVVDPGGAHQRRAGVVAAAASASSRSPATAA